MIPSDTQKFNSLGAFAGLGEVDWSFKPDSTIQKNDTVYIYCIEPIQKMMLKTIVTKVNVPKSERIDDSAFIIIPVDRSNKKYIRLKIVDGFFNKGDRFSLKELEKNGLKGPIQGSRILNNNVEVLDYIKSVENS